MAVNYTDFEKIWASTSPLTPYSFSDANYKRGWDFVGSTPPSRQMWDAFMQNADEKLQYLYLHEDVPVGHEYFTFNPNVPQGSLPLFGGEYSRETYSALWAWVQQQTGYLKTDAEWQTLAASNNGNVPYYSDGDGSTTFRVPSLKCYIKAADGTVTEVGSYYAAGLPNITGVFGSNVWNYAGANASGSFTKSQVGTYGGNVGSQGGTNYNFDASLSNSIYGNSNTVTPETVVGLWLVKAYGVIQDTGTINEQQYIDDRIAALPTSLATTFLPLAGGTMTGRVNADYSIGCSTNDILLNLQGGVGTDGEGAYLKLFGADNSSAGGWFSLASTDGTNNYTLQGTPAGLLQWAGKDVVTKKDETVSFTMTTNNGTASSLSAHRVGNVVVVNFGITTSSAVNAGGTISGTFSGLPQNVGLISVNSVSYFSASALILSATYTQYTIRVIGATLPAGSGFGMNFMYATVS